ncbi:ABC transporter permease [Sedimentibacter hydroxybenzoicus DSM 7310]|uniref:ABC transporter permease n=1 Tax=Sedimentibacter hydroxybenzoicus DSM 7310 TaxID=1123245 RepID=A0A974BLX3_SEDHY|nr:ABC transporter permease [Sedimentibacter hydroxybenzoicus]NYB75241.1 ABC transporter permease [Sedimentibacter hydroxybenzoicus DSM 7310]
MVRGSLFIKSLRDMRKSKAQFISIFIMATLAVFIMTGLDSIWFTVEKHADAMYRSANMSDLWVTVPNPSEQMVWGISKLDGVKLAEKRFTADADTALPGSPTLHVYALDGRSTLDQPEIHEGKFSKSGGAVLDISFAKAHNLKTGDYISIKLNSRWLRLKIDGLALSGEHVFAVKNSASLAPNHSEYGFIIINTDALKSIYGQKIYNQISVKTLPGSDIPQLVQKVGAVVGNNLIGITLQKDNGSVSSVNSRIQQFRTLSVVFPILFLLVTALITQSTMVRMIENQRSQIGILKALGYSKRSILWHYTSYGVMVGVLGSVLGLLTGPNIFGRIMVRQLNLTLNSYSLKINYLHFVFVLILILICTGGVSFLACRKLLSDAPAFLLRDKPPKSGQHIFLESISSVWEKMKFSSKLIARNMVKNKGRLIMSTIGVMGCTGVIISALTVRSTLSGISDYTYGTTFTFNQKIVLDTSKVNSTYLKNLELDGITQQIEETAVQVIFPDGSYKMELTNITTKESPLIYLQDIDGNPVSIPENGVLMTRKLCKEKGLKKGDIIQIKIKDKGYAAVPIEEIAYIASGQGIYMTDTYWESLGETFKPSALLVRWNGEPDQKFLDRDIVSDSATRESMQDGLSSSLGVVNLAVLFLIVLGSSLAFVVLYNTGMLNYVERVRDLATFRVLGFHNREIQYLVLIENYFSVLLGMLSGIPVGRFISWLIASTIDERLDLLGNIKLMDVLIAGAMTALFAWIVNKVIAHKMKELDIFEALKSVE